MQTLCVLTERPPIVQVMNVYCCFKDAAGPVHGLCVNLVAEVIRMGNHAIAMWQAHTSLACTSQATIRRAKKHESELIRT